jgi:hypothetical protein
MNKGYTIKNEDAKTLNTLAREQMKLKLLADISIDLQICKIEGWSVTQYLFDLRKLLNEVCDSVEKKISNFNKTK